MNNTLSYVYSFYPLFVYRDKYLTGDDKIERLDRNHLTKNF